MFDYRMFCIYYRINQLDYKSDNTVWIYSGKQHLNLFLNENTTLKYVYDSNTADREYVGFCSYRRYIFREHIENFQMDENSIIVYNKLVDNDKRKGYFGLNEWSNKNWYCCDYMYNDCLEFFSTIKDINYLEVEKYINEHRIFYNYNCFVMHKKKFEQLVKFIWGGYIDFIDKKYNLNYDPENYKRYCEHYMNYFKENNNSPCSYLLTNHGYRIMAYFIEWLVSYFITANFTNIYPIFETTVDDKIIFTNLK